MLSFNRLTVFVLYWFQMVCLMFEGKIVKKGEINITDLFEKVRDSKDFCTAGAITCFTGVVRATSRSGGRVRKLYVESWEEKAEKSLTVIAERMSKKEGITAVLIYHVVGELEVGDDIVYVIVAGDHRENIFPVLEETVELYKKEAEIWKKEILEDGSERWVE